MAVTVQMIENKEFKTKPHGYDPDEVDMFLDEIIEEFEDMQHEIQALRSASLRPQGVPPLVPAADNTEAVQLILVNAQRVSDETLADARRQAELLLADAKAKAERMIDEARTEAKRLQEGYDSLRSAATDYRARFRRLVDDQMHVINAETELFR